MKSLLYALSFLTIVPFSKEIPDERSLADSSVFFPVVGAFVGLLATCVSAFIGRLFSQDVAAAFYLLSLILVTGAFHMDGLSDTFDGLAVKGTGDVEQDRQARLSVMREGKQGPIGCTSIVWDLLLKYALCKELLGRGRLSPLFLAPVGSRFAMVLCCFIGRPARKEGLGVLFIGRKKKRNMLLSLLFTIGLFLLGRPCFSLSSILFLGISFLFLMFLLVRLFESRFGGLTGDTLGAINELSELLFLAFFLT